MAETFKGELAQEFPEVNGVQFLAKQVDLSPEGAKDLAYELGTLGNNLFLVLATVQEEKPDVRVAIFRKNWWPRKTSMQDSGSVNWGNSSKVEAEDSRFLPLPVVKRGRNLRSFGQGN